MQDVGSFICNCRTSLVCYVPTFDRSTELSLNSCELSKLLCTEEQHLLFSVNEHVLCFSRMHQVHLEELVVMTNTSTCRPNANPSRHRVCEEFEYKNGVTPGAAVTPSKAAPAGDEEDQGEG